MQIKLKWLFHGYMFTQEMKSEKKSFFYTKNKPKLKSYIRVYILIYIWVYIRIYQIF